MSTHLADLLTAADLADDDRRAFGRVPEVLQQPGAANEAYERWEAAHTALTEARDAEMDREAGQ